MCIVYTFMHFKLNKIRRRGLDTSEIDQLSIIIIRIIFKQNKIIQIFYDFQITGIVKY